MAVAAAGGPEGIPMLDVHGLAVGVQVRREDANLWRLDAGPSLEARIQLDGCGAWVTIGTDVHRPVVVRRAGWVELRGQPPEGTLRRWDRVGLGPGDAIVLPIEPSGDDLLDALLPHTGSPAAGIGAAVEGAHVVVRVPPFAPEDGPRLASEATGLPATTFDEPLHRPGSPDAELWRHRPAPPMEGRIRLEPRPASVPAARALLRRLVASWRMPELLDGVLELLATELLTNAVVHASTKLEVAIRYDGAALRFEVRDGDPVLPVPLPPSEDREGGRGVWMVSVLADRWGAAAWGPGKVVWFEIDVGGGDDDATVISAHGILQVARGLERAATDLRADVLGGTPIVDSASLQVLRDRSQLISDLLTDVVLGRRPSVAQEPRSAAAGGSIGDVQ